MQHQTNISKPNALNRNKGPWLLFLTEFFKEASLDGVKYIVLDGLHIVERIFWSIILIASLGLSVFLFFHLYQKYKANQVIISFQAEETRISQIPFPAITICNVNIFKDSMMNKVLETLIDEIRTEGYTKRQRFQETVAISEHITQYCLAAPSYRRILQEKLVASGKEDFVQKLQDVLEIYKGNTTLDRDRDYLLGETFQEEINDFRSKASHNCQDMILKCMWKMEMIPCQELFFHIRTQHGSCCVFNMMPQYILKKIPENDRRVKEEKAHLSPEATSEWEKLGTEDLLSDHAGTHPRRQRSGGKQKGLTVLINPELDLYSTCTTNDAWGFKVLAHSPFSFPGVMNYGEAVSPHREVFLEIEPELTTADEANMKSVHVGERNCYLPNDPETRLEHYKFYSLENCMDECIAKYTQAYCSCVQHFMPRTSSQKLCGAMKLRCTQEVRANLTASGKMGYCSHCKPACTEIKYRMHLTNFPIRNHDALKHFQHIHKDGTKKSPANFSILHIYFGADKFYAKARHNLFDLFEVLGHAGGVLGLTLGFSTTSLLEILYFFTLSVLFHLPFRRIFSKRNKAIAPIPRKMLI